MNTTAAGAVKCGARAADVWSGAVQLEWQVPGWLPAGIRQRQAVRHARTAWQAHIASAAAQLRAWRNPGSHGRAVRTAS